MKIARKEQIEKQLNKIAKQEEKEMIIITRTNNWKYKIKIKDQFEDKTTPELIIKLCDSLIIQLKQISSKVETSSLTEDEKDDCRIVLEEIIDHFVFLKELADGTIKKLEWDDYSFNGDYEEIFNDYLEQLYDIGDRRVINKYNRSEKFIWIE